MRRQSNRCQHRGFRLSAYLHMPFVYMLRCRDGSLYTGIAKDVQKRLKLHQAGRGAKYTASRRPVELVWTREVPTWRDAMREEVRIKRMTRVRKLALVETRDKTCQVGARWSESGTAAPT
jgi:putative endonuclease